MAELPWLKNKNKQSTGTAVVKVPDQSNDDMLIEQLGQELLDAFERRDIKSLREAIYAIANMIKEQDDAL